MKKTLDIRFQLIIRVFNHANYLKELLNSIEVNGIFISNKKALFITFIDDCSIDNSIEIINEWIFSHELDMKLYEIIINNKNMGYNYTFIQSLNAAKMDKYLILDGDDLVGNQNLADYFILFENYDITFSSKYLLISEKLKINQGWFVEFLFLKFFFLRNFVLKRGNPLQFPGSLIKRELLNDPKLYNFITNSEYPYDYALWIYLFTRSKLKLKVYNSFKNYVIYRPNNIRSRINSKKIHSKKNIFVYFLWVIYKLVQLVLTPLIFNKYNKRNLSDYLNSIEVKTLG